MQLSITLPTSWEQVTPPLLHYILLLTAHGHTTEQIKAHILLRHIPPHARPHIPTEALAAALTPLAFLDHTPHTPLRPDTLLGHRALDAELHGLPFARYLIIENLWQALLTKLSPQAPLPQLADSPLLSDLYHQLYPRRDLRRTLLPTHPHQERTILPLALILWLTSLRTHLAHTFPHLYQPTHPTADPPDMRQVMETQIRALTAGDITRRDLVLQSDTWAALTELDAKAREAESINKS